MRISPWVWVGLAVVGALAVFVQQSSQASYWRGIADDAESRLETQQIVLDSVTVHADSLAEALAEADSAIVAQRLQAEREVASLTRDREEARRRSGALSATLRADLDSVQAVELDAVVESYEAQVMALEGVVEVERSLTAAERLRESMEKDLERFIEKQQARLEQMAKDLDAVPRDAIDERMAEDIDHVRGHVDRLAELVGRGEMAVARERWEAAKRQVAERRQQVQGRLRAAEQEMVAARERWLEVSHGSRANAGTEPEREHREAARQLMAAGEWVREAREQHRTMTEPQRALEVAREQWEEALDRWRWQ